MNLQHLLQKLVLATTAPLAAPPPKRKAKRNELDNLTDDIAQMYYANDVMRATGRKACTTATFPCRARLESQ
ncbi:hypothetical protein ACLKA6_012884 [Drosophila palustris]